MKMAATIISKQLRGKIMEAKDLFDIQQVFTNIPDILRYLPVTMELAIGSSV